MGERPSDDLSCRRVFAGYFNRGPYHRSFHRRADMGTILLFSRDGDHLAALHRRALARGEREACRRLKVGDAAILASSGPSGHLLPKGEGPASGFSLIWTPVARY